MCAAVLKHASVTQAQRLPAQTIRPWCKWIFTFQFNKVGLFFFKKIFSFIFPNAVFHLGQGTAYLYSHLELMGVETKFLKFYRKSFFLQNILGYVMSSFQRWDVGWGCSELALSQPLSMFLRVENYLFRSLSVGKLLSSDSSNRLACLCRVMDFVSVRHWLNVFIMSSFRIKNSGNWCIFLLYELGTKRKQFVD